ncbi:FkbM family methyltransferase [Aliiroseovarius sp. Z3]|uniref:FkbM family methyltransferase n=1 Tax=Aliiroseovarius sp. Z3 TaxID=2811402 RepID=UPI0023B33B67|nr:FkbM family methyltransferase [Aliiroseovarius sp. Z3]MDE9449107.1 FkbM family methyltransferase [Aliiroseovarius sp. Z3]
MTQRREYTTPDAPEIVATYHGVEVPDAPHLGPTMIANMKAGRYERREVEAALALIKSRDRVVEMGAGTGVVGAVIAKNCQPEAITSFEANHKLIDHARALYDHNGLANLISLRYQIVISEPTPPETVEFFIRGNFLGSGMTITKGQATAEKVQVPVAAWADIKAECQPTVLVMDIEGAELGFFRHADLSGIHTMIVELHRHIYHRPGMREIRDGLAAQGFVENPQLSRGGVFAFERPPQ